MMIRMHIHRMLNGMTKTIKITPVAERRIPGDHVILFTHQHRIPQYLPGFVPGYTVFGIDSLIVPDSRRMQHRVIVDFCNGGAVFFTGKAN
ncbi:hypothetical protein D3C73_1226270 [compost metagenome]